ncbi:MAG: glycine zipper domain-containing protein [Ramlibacter sp.]
MTPTPTGDTPNLQASRDKLAHDIAAVAAEAADLLEDAGGRGFGRVLEALDEARSALRDGGGEMAGATRAYVQAHPLQTLGIAAAAGLVLGLLLARR